MSDDLGALSGRPEKAGDATANHDVMDVAVKAAQKMQESVSFTPAPIPKDKMLISVLKKIPLLTGLLSDADGTTAAIGELVEVTGKVAGGFEKAAKGLHFAGLALDIVNFIRIPCIYIAAAVLGIKPPIKLSNNAKWAYSAFLLAVAIVSLTVPAIAPFLAIGAAAIALGVAVFTLGRLLYQRHQHKKAIKDLTSEIETEEKNLLAMQTRARELEVSLNQAVADQDNKLANQLMSEITLLQSKYEAQKQTLQTLHDKRFVHQESLKKKDTGKIVDKAVGVILAAVVVIGLVVSLFFPPVGLGLLIGAGAAGLLYTVGRLMTPLFVKLANRIRERFMDKAASPDDLKDKDAPDLGNKLTVEQVSAHAQDPLPVSSTTITALGLSGKQAAKDLREQIAYDEWLDKIESRLEFCITNHEARGMLLIARDMALHQYTRRDLVGYLNQTASLWAKGYELLRQAVDQVANKEMTLSSEDTSQLLSSGSLIDVLQDKGIDLQRLASAPVMTENTHPVLSLVEEEHEDEGETEGEGGKYKIR